MNAYEYIVSKQVLWAKNRGIKLVGSKGERGRKTYVDKNCRDDNLFEPLEPSVEADIRNGDGHELDGDYPKINALHSSSALGVNIFQYWKKINQVPKIAVACSFCSKDNLCSIDIKFEKKYPIKKEFETSPNIDVVIENTPGSKFADFAVECKFSEAYSPRQHAGLDQKYIKVKEIWNSLSNLRGFAETISPADEKFKHLHPAQLIKHILGLMQAHKDRNKFKLLYLWYDCPGLEEVQHRGEIEEFTGIAKKDMINFHALSYQELIIKLANDCYLGNENYIKYISERYL